MRSVHRTVHEFNAHFCTRCAGCERV